MLDGSKCFHGEVKRPQQKGGYERSSGPGLLCPAAATAYSDSDGDQERLSEGRPHPPPRCERRLQGAIPTADYQAKLQAAGLNLAHCLAGEDAAVPDHDRCLLDAL